MQSLHISKLYPWHYHPQSAAWGIKEYPGLFVQRFQLHHHDRVDYPWNAFGDCSGMALSHPMWARARGDLSIAEFGNQLDWIWDAIEPLENKWFQSRRDALQALQITIWTWESRYMPRVLPKHFQEFKF